MICIDFFFIVPQSAYKSPPAQGNKSTDPKPLNFPLSNTGALDNSAFCTPTTAYTKGILNVRINVEEILKEYEYSYISGTQSLGITFISIRRAVANFILTL
jgi:hypothetical protein